MTDTVAFQKLTDNLMIGVVAFEIQTRRCLYMNRQATQMLHAGPDPEAYPLESLDPKIANSPGMLAFSLQLLQRDGFHQDVMIKTGTGQMLVTQIGVKLFPNETTPYAVLMIQDTTLQKKLLREIDQKQQALQDAYSELLEQNQQLKELDVAKNRFIALTTHELRTPAAAMLATSEVLKLGLYDNEEQLKEFVDTIYTQAQHLLNLINDVLDFAKIQAGKMDLYVEALNLPEILRAELQNQENFAQKQEIQIEYPKADLPNAIWADEMRLRQVFANIISNAIKYNRANGKVWVDLITEENMIAVSVHDTGVGIPQEQMAQVFNEFETLGKVALHHEGTGLGMPITKRLIEAMGGSIHIQSEVGKGSTFTVRIPTTKVLADEVYRARPDLLGDLAA